MPMTIEVVFTGLTLFCLNEGTYCNGKLDTAYLVNVTEDAKVCGRDLDGGHEPLISFDARYLLDGATQPYELVPGPGRHELVVASLRGVELCICPEAAGGCPRPAAGDPGAVAVTRWTSRRFTHPVPYWQDEHSFDWVPNLSRLHVDAENKSLCPQVEQPLFRNPLVTSRVRLDRGTVLTAPDWEDDWGSFWQWLWRRPMEMDYLVWEASPEITGVAQPHFRKAMPGNVMWRMHELDDETVVLLQDCHEGRPQRTLFRLRPRRGDLKIHISNSPFTKHPLAVGAELEHFRWYYRLVDWKDPSAGCSDLNATSCPDDLPIPFMPEKQIDRMFGSAGKKLQKIKPDLKGVLTQTQKCPPGSTG